jgi:predicted aspartyl protease
MKHTRWLTILLCLPLLATRGHDVRFAVGQSALCIPFDGVNRHVAFTARLNDREGMLIVLDTGAGGSVLDAGRVESLGLTATGSQRALGSGGAVQGAMVHGVDVSLPGFQLLDQTMGTLPLGSLAAQAGRRLDGILGYPLFARCVVEIDYARKCVSLFDAAGYSYRGPGVSVPITFKENLPYVKARVVLPDGRSITGKFAIDTGASTSLILSPGPVEREGVVASLGKTMTVQSHGVGGATPVRLARVAKLELGGFTLEQPVTALQPPGVGRVSAEGTIGNIGGGILSRFKVTFDYSRRRMILEPGPDLALPFEADMSGLGLVSVPPEFRRVTVARVLDASPALEAGIEVGDEIETVNGKPVAELGVAALRERLRQEGQDVRFELLRGTERIALAIRTRRLI